MEHATPEKDARVLGVYSSHLGALRAKIRYSTHKIKTPRGYLAILEFPIRGQFYVKASGQILI